MHKSFEKNIMHIKNIEEINNDNPLSSILQH